MALNRTKTPVRDRGFRTSFALLFLDRGSALPSQRLSARHEKLPGPRTLTGLQRELNMPGARTPVDKVAVGLHEIASR